MNIEEANAMAEGFYRSVQVVTMYMDERKNLIMDVISNPQTGHRDSAIKGLWLRALAWMKSLEILNHTKHIQAIASGNRALFEIMVDIFFLHHDKTNGAGWRMHWWAQSEKLKSAELLIKFYKNQGKDVPNEHKPIEEFYNNEKANIESIRQDLWGTTKHPQRWSLKDLSKDTETIDSLYGSEIENDLGILLLAYYRTKYSQINWQIHSGLAGFWNLSPEALSAQCAALLKSSADFGMLITKIVLKDFGYKEVIPELEQEWENVHRHRSVEFFKATSVQRKLNDNSIEHTKKIGDKIVTFTERHENS